MMRLIIVSTLVALATASGYGGYGGGLGLGMGGGYGMAGGLGAGIGYGGYAVPAAVISHHSVKHYDVPSSGYVHPTTIDVPFTSVPMNIIFRSASSHLNVQQHHVGARGNYQETYSQDEPHYLKHTVKKPIYQEVREIISPYRKITQEIKPVHEEIQTVVARGSHYGNMGGHGGMGSMGYGYKKEGGY